MEKKKYKRVLLKLSGEALAGEKGQGFDEETVQKVAKQVKDIVNQGVQVGIVIGAGNFWRGRSNPQMDRTKADQIGMLATVMNCLYAAEIFRTIGLSTSVLSPFKFATVTKEFSKDLAVELLENQQVVFFAGGIGHPFFSTDTTVVLRALEVDADVILLAKNIDGIYDSDPRVNKDAVRYDEITLDEVIEKKLQAMDLAGVILAKENNMPMLAFYLNDENSIVNAINGNIKGTYINV